VEPAFTNFARLREDPFIGTLDYVFVSSQFMVTGALPLPSQETLSGPLPDENEPSDHLMLAVDLQLPLC
jgi:2',5'-phosphodiesterase